MISTEGGDKHNMIKIKTPLDVLLDRPLDEGRLAMHLHEYDCNEMERCLGRAIDVIRLSRLPKEI
jgi:hypothetical protein